MGLSMFELTDKVAIVTGAGRGIGKAIALGYADAGAHVVVCARTPAEIETTASEIRGKGRQGLAIVADVRHGAQVANLVEKTLEKFGRIDVLMNNAGGSFRVMFMESTERVWDAFIAQNLKSTFLCTQAVARVMIKQKGGVIINMSSNLGQLPAPGMAVYGAIKAGIIQLTSTLAVELAPYNIRVNVIVPGLTETPGVAEFYNKYPELKRLQLERIPLGRLGRPDDIVGAAIYLASDASSYVTGTAINVNGAFTSVTA